MPEALQRQIGPFAVWQWLLIAGGGVALGLVVRRLMPRDTPLAALDETVDGGPEADVGTQPGTVGYQTQPPIAGGGYGPAPGPTTVQPGYVPTTNLQWGNYVQSLLVARGISPVLAASAVTKYLDGIALTAQEEAILGEALALAGPPPEGAPPPLDEQQPEPDPEPPADDEPDDTPPVYTPPVYTPPVYTPPAVTPPVVWTPPPGYADESAFVTFLGVWFRSEFGRSPTAAEVTRWTARWREYVAQGLGGAAATSRVKADVREAM